MASGVRISTSTRAPCVNDNRIRPVWSGLSRNRRPSTSTTAQRVDICSTEVGGSTSVGSIFGASHAPIASANASAATPDPRRITGVPPGAGLAVHPLRARMAPTPRHRP